MPVSAAYSYRPVPFGCLRNDLLKAMAEKGKQLIVAKGDLLFREGEPCKGLYLATSCCIRLYLSAPDGCQQTIAILKPGELFDVAPIFDGGPCVFTAQALGTGLVWFLSKEEVLAISQAYPEFTLSLLKDAFEKAHLLVRLAESLAMQDVTTRVASLLLQYAQDSGILTPDGIRVTVGLSQRELASLLGTKREVVSRSFRRLEREGLIQAHYPEILILDLPGLQCRA